MDKRVIREIISQDYPDGKYALKGFIELWERASGRSLKAKRELWSFWIPWLFRGSYAIAMVFTFFLLQPLSVRLGIPDWFFDGRSGLLRSIPVTVLIGSGLPLLIIRFVRPLKEAILTMGQYRRDLEWLLSLTDMDEEFVKFKSNDPTEVAMAITESINARQRQLWATPYQDPEEIENWMKHANMAASRFCVLAPPPALIHVS